jgi:hypothetical protein
MIARRHLLILATAAIAGLAPHRVQAAGISRRIGGKINYCGIEILLWRRHKFNKSGLTNQQAHAPL